MPQIKKYWKMEMSGKEAAEIYIYSDIGQPGFFNPDSVSAKQFKDDLDALGKVTQLTIRINSYGGEVFEGNAIYNHLLGHKASKTVIIDGIAASQASVIAMVADQGKLQMRENAFIMVHKASMGVIGNKDDFTRYAKLLGEIEQNAIKAYQRHAKELTEKEIQELLDEETWLNANDAKTYGFVDEIIEGTEVEEPATNTGRQIPMNIKHILFKSNGGIKIPVNKGVPMVKCKHCGKEIAEGLLFCGHCGKAVNEAPVDPINAAHNKEVDEAKAAAAKEAATAEQKRVLEITSRCSKHNLPVDFQNSLITGNVPVYQAISKILDKIEEIGNNNPVSPDIKIVKDDAEKFRTHAVNCLSIASGLEKDKKIIDEAKKDKPINTVHGLLQRCLQRQGIDPIGLNPNSLVEKAIRMAASGTSDLPYVLADTANKALLAGFNEAPTTFQEWCGEMEVPDFRSMSLVKMSTFSDVDEIPEGMNFKEGKFSDKRETVAVTTKGKKFSITRQALVNDDLRAITRVPYAMTAAIKRRMNKDVYDSLTSNTLVGPTMSEDSVALFDASTHANLIDPSNVPSVSTIGIANAALMKMKLPKATPETTQQYTNLSARYLITGVDNMLTVEQILNSVYDPASTGAATYNPFYNKIIGIYDAYLQALITGESKQYAWYLATDKNALDTYGIAYLAGNRTPTLRSEPSGIGEALGFLWDAYFDWGVYLADWRGLIYNDGAAS